VRLRDKVFSEDWRSVPYIRLQPNILWIIRIAITQLGLLLIAFYSLATQNIIIFTIWFGIAIIVFLIDTFKGTNITLSLEVTFGTITLIATILSVKFADYNSIFFISFSYRPNVLFTQTFAAIFLIGRFFLTLFILEWYPNIRVLLPESKYARNQVKEYKSNLVKTDFEFKRTEKVNYIEKIRFILKGTFIPTFIQLLFITAAMLYAFLIYLITPSDAVAQFYVIPALFFVALIYVAALMRLSNKIASRNI